MTFRVLGKPTIEDWPELSENSIFMELQTESMPVITQQPFIEVE